MARIYLVISIVICKNIPNNIGNRTAAMIDGIMLVIEPNIEIISSGPSNSSGKKSVTDIEVNNAFASNPVP